jgi:hypothetical protein
MNLRDTALAYPLGAAGGSAMRKGLVSSDLNHTGIEGPVKVREKLQPAEERVDG